MDVFSEVSPHRPLGASEIRVISLHPGEWDDPIVCTLKHVSLDGEPEYNTVSYVWGDPTPVYEIMLDNVSYPVAANLYQVLHRLRDYNRWHPRDGDEESSESLCLWIDALCINQLDMIERAAQVQRMTEIYTKATKLFAYVGEHDPEREESVEKLFSIPWEPLKRDDYREAHAEDEGNTEDASQSEQSSTGPANWFSWKELAERVDGDPSDLKKCLTDLCTEAFFSRIWIVQEITLSQLMEALVLYGSQSTNVVFLLELVVALRYDHIHSGPDFLEIGKVTSNAYAMLSGGYSYARPPEGTQADLVEHLLELLRDTQLYQATEPRDKIYALLGLVNKDLLPAYLLPSYDKPIGTIYQRWTKFLLEHTGDLSIIDGSCVDDPSVPTWVSALSMQTDRKTAAHDPANVRFSDDGKILHVKGRLICFVLGAYSPPGSMSMLQLDNSSKEQEYSSLVEQALKMEETLMRHVRAAKSHGEAYVPYLFDLMLRLHGKKFDLHETEKDLLEAVTQAYEQIVAGNDVWKNASTDVHQALQKLLRSHDWVVLSDGCSVYRLEANRYLSLPRPADEVYYLEGSGGFTILRRCEEQETFMRIGYCDADTEREQWSQLESAVDGELDIEVGGRQGFRPRVGLVDIAIS